MNTIIAAFLGCFTFILMLGLKIPIKKLTGWIAKNRYADDERRRYILYKRLNILVIAVTLLVAIVGYKYVFQYLHESHYDFSCSLKGGAIALAIFAIYDQVKE